MKDDPMKTYSAFVPWLVLTSALLAQTAPPALLVKSEGRSLPLGLAKLHCEVRIFGSVAETATTMTFTNPTPRVMEGDLYFPLPEGATISGYALDIGDVLVDGVTVEKHEARRVFEQVVRQGIDPGLVQWTAGNNFHTRVFPIPANGSRTIRVQYVTEVVGGRDQPAFHLPLRFREKLHEFSLRVEVVKPAAPPNVTQGAPANFAFTKWRDSYVAETKLADVALGEDLVVALPKPTEQHVLVEKTEDGQVFFAIQDFPAAPLPQASSAAPRHVVVFWDASGSRGAADHKREIEVLRACLDRWLGGMGASRQALRVDLVLLRHATGKPERTELTRAELAKWIAGLAEVSYDGGTQLGAVGPRRIGFGFQPYASSPPAAPSYPTCRATSMAFCRSRAA
jgi:hypothetical protein